MSDHYLGIVDYIHPDGWGRIIPLKALKAGADDGHWEVDPASPSRDWGEDGRIRWTNIPPDQSHHAGNYVRFRVERESAVNGLGRKRERYRVAAQSGEADRYPVEVQGLWPVLSLNVAREAEIPLSHEVKLPLGAIVYRSYKNDTRIDGPWRVASGAGDARLLRPDRENHVFEHRAHLLESRRYVRSPEGRHAVLLYEPPSGEVHDLMPERDLPRWLLDLLASGGGVGEGLDRALADWEGRATAAIAGDEPTRRNLHARRLRRLRDRIELLDGDDAHLAALVDLPRFRQYLDDAIERRVQSHQGEIEQQARNRVMAPLAEFERRTREQIAERRAEAEALRGEIDELERLRDRRRAESEEASRQRLLHDFLATPRPAEAPSAPGGCPCEGRRAAGPPIPLAAEYADAAGEPSGPVVADSAAFVRDRLTPILAGWGAEARGLQAKLLHAALLACRWVATPCPTWGVAYTEALGGTARHLVVHAEPTWLTFDDAWKGEIGAFWSHAEGRPDEFHLLIVADADRAPAQCWASPLLDVVAGLRAGLPSGLRWPDNLRLMACPARDSATLPVPDWVVAHWAGVRRADGGPGAEAPSPPGGPADGHVPLATWRGWVAPPAEAIPLNPALGRAARSAAREGSALLGTLRTLMDADDDRRCDIREGYARAIFSAGEER